MFQRWIYVCCPRWFAAVVLCMSSAIAVADGLSFDQALQLALRQSAEIKAETARVEAARQAQEPADALPDPTLILGLDNVPVEGPDRYSLSSDFMTMQRIGLTQRFPNRSKREARAQAARQRVGLAESMTAQTRLAVLRQTAWAWIEGETVRRQLQLLDEMLDENRLFDQAVRARLSSGQGKALESIEPRREAAALLDQKDSLQARQRQAEAQLVRWLGEAGRRPLTGNAPVFEINTDVLLQGLHQHPELDVARYQAAVADAMADEARAAKKPDWALTLAYMDREDFSDMAMLQINVDLPLFSGSRQGPRIASAEAERLSLQARADAVRREHQAMLQSDLAEFERLQRALLRQHETLIPLAEEKIALASAAWRSGKGSLADLIQARSELLNARLMEMDLGGSRDQMAAALHFTYDHHDAAAGEHEDEH